MSRGLFQSERKTVSFPLAYSLTQKYLSEKYTDLLSGDTEKNKNQLRTYTQQFILEQGLEVNGFTSANLVDKLIDELTGYSFLSSYLDFRIPNVEEININSWDDVKITYSNGQKLPAPDCFFDSLHATNVIRRLLRKSSIILDDAKPCVRGHLNKKIRVTVNGPGVIDDDVGVTASIRFVNPQKLGKEDFIRNGTATEEMLDFLSILYRYGISQCLAGPTGSGKTTIIGWIMSTIPDDKRLITIENGTREFDLRKRDELGRIINNVIHLCTRYSDDPAQNITLQILLEQTLTFNPDFLCMAEMKGAEAYETQAAARTSTTTISTVHANNCEQIHDRILDLCTLKSNISDNLLSKFVVEAFPITFFARQMEDKVRRITDICETYMDNNGKRQINRLFQFKTLRNEIVNGKTVIEGKFERVGSISKNLQLRLIANGIPEQLLQKLIGGEIS